jgi:hypothetical protein
MMDMILPQTGVVLLEPVAQAGRQDFGEIPISLGRHFAHHRMHYALIEGRAVSCRREHYCNVR